MANNQIALLAQAPVFDTPFESQAKALKIRDMMYQSESQDMDMRQRRQSMEDDGIARAAFSANPTDSAARLAALARAPKAYAAERTALQNAEKVTADIGQTKASTRKTEIEGEKAQMEVMFKKLSLVGQIMGGVKDQASWTRARQRAVQEFGLKAASDMPEQYDQDLVEENRQQALSVEEQLGQMWKQKGYDLDVEKFGEDKRKNKAQEGAAAARLKFDKGQAATGDDAPLDPLSVRTTAQQYLAGDNGALANIGRGAQGARNLVLVRNEIARMANAQGLNGADIAAKIAEFGGMKAGQRTLGTRTANIEVAATEAAELAPLAVEASSRVARSGLLPFGKAQIMFDTQTNDPNLRQFAMANTALANAYGQVMSRGGVATVSDKEHARELLATAFDHPSYVAAVDQLQAEIRAAQRAPGKVREEMRKETSGKGGHAAPNSDAKPSLDDIFGKK